MGLLEKMKAKLQRLESELDELFGSNPRNGHGGTPNIIDNTKGRQMMRVQERLNDRMEFRIERQSTQTKKSKKFIDKNPIHAGLFELEKQGLVKQWPRNPQYFFIVGLERVALATFDGVIHRCQRFPTKNAEEKARAEELINIAMKA